MKRLLAICILFVMAVANMQAKQLNKEQMTIRLNVVKYLSQEGYSPKIDEDGDVRFKSGNFTYYVIIDEDWSNPYLITLYLQFSYSEDGGKYTRENLKKCIADVAKYRTVKLYCGESSFSFRSDILCKNSDVFAATFKQLLKSMDGAWDAVKEKMESGLVDIDVTGDKDGAFERAKGYYDEDEYSKAFPIMKELADAGYTKAYTYVAYMYKYGKGTSEDKEKMAVYYEKAVDAGYNNVANSLGLYYYEKKDYEKALKYFLKCGSSENTSRATALANAGYIYEYGKGMAVDREKAVQCYRKSLLYSTELESTARKALIRLKEPVENKADFIEATKTMLMGLTVDQMYDKGLAYEQGLNNHTVSLPKAYAYFKAAADRDNTKALLKMGDIMISEYYPFNDKSKSDKYYQKAFKVYKHLADNNDGDACNELGCMYQKGKGVKVDKDQAKYYFKKGAVNGDKNAAWRYGLVCKDEVDYAEAFKYFYKAAEDGQGMAMYELAKLYEDGMGVNTDKEKAIEWYKKCAKSSYAAASDAEEALERLGKK